VNPFLPYLLGALLLSLAGNAFLGWQWAESGAECDARVAEAERDAIADERERAAKDAKAASQIATDTHTDTMRAVTAVIKGALTREQQFAQTPVSGECVMPATPLLQSSIDAANRAAGD
jgi:hypothetical protein